MRTLTDGLATMFWWTDLQKIWPIISSCASFDLRHTNVKNVQIYTHTFHLQLMTIKLVTMVQTVDFGAKKSWSIS